MKFKIASLAVLGAVLLSPTVSSAQQAGEYALAQFQGNAKWFPGVVVSRFGYMVRVRYDDGTVEDRPRNQVRAYDWRVGSKIECMFTDNQWYAATITAMNADGVSLAIRYDDDGVMERTTTAKCRADW